MSRETACVFEVESVCAMVLCVCVCDGFVCVCVREGGERGIQSERVRKDRCIEKPSTFCLLKFFHVATPHT